MNEISKPKSNRPLRGSLRYATLTAPFMCGGSLVFLALIAVLVVLFVDVPRVDAMGSEASASQHSFWLIQVEGALLVLWAVFFLDLIFKFLLAYREGRQLQKADYASMICPPLRLGMPVSALNGRLWLPGLGWRRPGKGLSKDLERLFSSPMLLIALLILPVLLIEFRFQDQVEAMPWLQTSLHVCTGLIWYAFAVEFIVMVNATDKRLRYVKKNWIDLAIILLPLISFLRSLRIMRAMRLAKFAKVQQLTKMTRVYRMRGLLAKTLRALMVFEVLHRILRTPPEKRLSRLEEQLAEKQDELNELRQRIDAVKAEIRQAESASADSDHEVDRDVQGQPSQTEAPESCPPNSASSGEEDQSNDQMKCA